jgi:hypothetical protein
MARWDGVGSIVIWEAGTTGATGVTGRTGGGSGGGGSGGGGGGGGRGGKTLDNSEGRSAGELGDDSEEPILEAGVVIPERSDSMGLGISKCGRDGMQAVSSVAAAEAS